MLKNLHNYRDKSGQKRKYLIVIKNLSFLYSHFWHLAESVRDAGWEVWIAAVENASPQRIYDAGLHYIAVSDSHHVWNLFGEVRAVLRVSAALRSLRPAIVHFIYLKNVLTGGILARIHKTPAVLGAVTGLGTLFASDEKRYRVMRRWVVVGLRIGFRHPNAMIVLENSDDRRELIDCDIIELSRTAIIPGAGVERTAILPVDEPPGIPVILCASRMIRQKGILDLIAASQLLQARGCCFELWLAGGVDSGNPKAISREQLSDAERRGLAKWLGHRADIAQLLSKAAIFCLPTNYREGLPRVLVEAGAAGVPIVTTDVPGCREVVEPGCNGLLIPPHDVTALADALESLLRDSGARMKMRMESRRIFEERFTADSVRDAFNHCFQKLSIDLCLSASRPGAKA